MSSKKTHPLTTEDVENIREWNDRVMCYCPLCLLGASVAEIVRPWVEVFFTRKVTYSVGVVVQQGPEKEDSKHDIEQPEHVSI
jgi:hypothetical protein